MSVQASVVIDTGITSRSCYSVCYPVTTRYYQIPYAPENPSNDVVVSDLYSNFSNPGSLIGGYEHNLLLWRANVIAAQRLYSTTLGDTYNYSNVAPIGDPKLAVRLSGSDIIIGLVTGVNAWIDNKAWIGPSTRASGYPNYLQNAALLPDGSSLMVTKIESNDDSVNIPADGYASLWIGNVTVTVHSNGTWGIYSATSSTDIDSSFTATLSDGSTVSRTVYGEASPMQAGTSLIKAEYPLKIRNYIDGLHTITTTLNFGSFSVGGIIDSANFKVLTDIVNQFNKVCHCVGNFYDESQYYCSCNY